MCLCDGPGVCLEVHLLVVHWVEVLVVVHEVVPELVVFGSLPTQQWLVHVLYPHAQLTPGLCHKTTKSLSNLAALL